MRARCPAWGSPCCLLLPLRTAGSPSFGKGVGGHEHQGHFQLQLSATPPNSRSSESLFLEDLVVRSLCHPACPNALGTASPVKPQRHRDPDGGLAAHPDSLPSSPSPPRGSSLPHSMAGSSFPHSPHHPEGHRLGRKALSETRTLAIFLVGSVVDRTFPQQMLGNEFTLRRPRAWAPLLLKSLASQVVICPIPLGRSVGVF